MALLVLVGCDDTTFPAPDGGDATGYAAVVALADRACLGCHGADVRTAELDLETDPCAALVGVVSTGYAPALRVSAGDHAASVLWNKLAATGEYGQEMPPGAGTAAETAEAVAAWIDDGAPCGAR